MERILEPELMDDDEQARAYAEADFEDAHNSFIAHFRETFGDRNIGGFALDLGCGAADITIRFARAFPDCVVHAVDGSAAMLRYGGRSLARAPELGKRIRLIRGVLPGAVLPRSEYDTIFSNSLLHHLPEPSVLWQAIKRYGTSGTAVFVMDLMRPALVQEAEELVRRYSGNEPPILQRDFYNSLLAAFEVDEVAEQLADAGLSEWFVKPVSDRHLVIAGEMP